MWPAAASVASVMLLMACASELPATTPDPTATPGSTASTDPFTSARAAPDAPEEIRDPASRASCGHLVRYVATGLPRDATDCLERSIGSKRAELAVAQYTAEGDPIVTFYLTYPDLVGYDVVVDQRQDTFSSGGFAHYRCAGAKTLDDSDVSCSDR